MAVGASIRWNNQNVWIISVHLESKTDAGNRRFQIDRLLMYLNKHIGDAPCVIGGDLNTNTNCEKQLILNKNDNFIIGETETMFYSFKRNGFEWANSNTLETTQRSRPDGNPKPPFSKLDWILVRGLDASEPQTVAARPLSIRTSANFFPFSALPELFLPTALIHPLLYASWLLVSAPFLPLSPRSVTCQLKTLLCSKNPE